MAPDLAVDPDDRLRRPLLHHADHQPLPVRLHDVHVFEYRHRGERALRH